MATTFTRQYRSSFPRYNFASIEFVDFSGGLNLLGAPSQLADNETADCLNITLDERGGVVKRLGFTRVNSAALDSIPQQLFWWDEQSTFVFQVGTKVYSTNNNFASTTLRKTYSTTERAAFTTFNGKVIAVHPADRVSTFDGFTWSDIGGSPKGKTIATWQNKCWVGDDPDHPTRVTFSNAGDATVWTSFVEVREGTDAPVKALGAGQGQDIAGRAGLLVYKMRSVHRINDSTSGAYTTITLDGGASNHNAVVASHGITCSISDRGVLVLDDNDTPAVASQKIDRLFRASQMNFAQTGLFAAGAFRDRIYFSFPYGSAQTTNNRTLEFIPATGAFVIHNFAANAFALYRSGTEQLYGASTDSFYVHSLFNTGSDNGAAIACHWQSKWFEPMAMGAARYRQAELEGRGVFDLYVKRDFDTGQGTHFPLDFTSTSDPWGTFVWNVDPWGPGSYEQTTRIYEMGVGRQIAFRMQQTGTTSTTAPNLIGDGTGDETGAVAFYGVRLDFVPLGLS